MEIYKIFIWNVFIFIIFKILLMNIYTSQNVNSKENLKLKILMINKLLPKHSYNLLYKIRTGPTK